MQLATAGCSVATCDVHPTTMAETVSRAEAAAHVRVGAGATSPDFQILSGAAYYFEKVADRASWDCSLVSVAAVVPSYTLSAAVIDRKSVV